jgi:hypothetical protein
MGLTEIMALLPSVIKAGSSLYNYVKDVKKAAIQKREWTPEIESMVQSKMESESDKDHWKTDSELAAE